MPPDVTPLIVGLLILAASVISLRLGLSVAIIEVLAGVAAGNLGIRSESWMVYLAGFGGVFLTFLAGTEIDTALLRDKAKESILIGGAAFLVPFLAAFAYVYLVAGWRYDAALVAGVAVSTTSLAVVYSVLVETGLGQSSIGKLLMAATFVTNMCSALALSLLFVRWTTYTLIFLLVSGLVIWGALRFSHLIFENPHYRDKVIEPEIKYIFVLLLLFMYFAQLGNGQAVLPAFILGLVMSRHFTETAITRAVRNRLRTVAYALVTPMFFIVGGLNVSLSLIWSGIALFAVLFAIKMITKFAGVYQLARRYIPNGSMYVTLLMSTGLTFGTIASVFGLSAGLIDRQQYSVLIGVVIASAVIPTVIAQKWFMPKHAEDLVELGNGER
jgi:Kef-type K+ transport system membrane component KefB